MLLSSQRDGGGGGQAMLVEQDKCKRLTFFGWEIAKMIVRASVYTAVTVGQNLGPSPLEIKVNK